MACCVRHASSTLSALLRVGNFRKHFFQNPLQFMGNAAAIRDAIGGTSERKRSSHLAKGGKSFLWTHGHGFLPDK